MLNKLNDFIACGSCTWVLSIEYKVLKNTSPGCSVCNLRFKSSTLNVLGVTPGHKVTVAYNIVPISTYSMGITVAWTWAFTFDRNK